MKKKINWKVRFKNKVWLSSFISLIIGFIFNLLKLFEVYPPFSESTIMGIAANFLTFLGLFGIVADPTTEGLYDSERALGYDEPWSDSDTEEHEVDAPEESEAKN